MANYPGLYDEEDELDGPMPVSTIAGPQTPREQVMQRIASVRQSSGDDEESGTPGTQDRDAAIQFAKNSALTAGLGRAANAFAAGTGFKADNSGYEAMEKQGNDFAMKEMDRSARVRQAIEARKGKEAALAFAGQQRDRAQSETERHNRAMESNSALIAKAARGARDQSIADKQAEKEEALTTNYGIARTPDDAKKLKDAAELKESFDRKVTEMIDLRKKHGGGAILDREDVQRGKQLSKDLLLAYKDMAKLGVLSKSDENILNAIIPSDPLEFNLSGLSGQDPTMHRMNKFKEDTNKDFQSRIANRVRGGSSDQLKTSQSGDAPTTKVVNGKTYRKVPGGWEEVE